jgi:hypothetical protein
LVDVDVQRHTFGVEDVAAIHIILDGRNVQRAVSVRQRNCETTLGRLIL